MPIAAAIAVIHENKAMVLVEKIGFRGKKVGVEDRNRNSARSAVFKARFSRAPAFCKPSRFAADELKRRAARAWRGRSTAGSGDFHHVPRRWESLARNLLRPSQFGG